MKKRLRYAAVVLVMLLAMGDKRKINFEKLTIGSSSDNVLLLLSNLSYPNEFYEEYISPTISIYENESKMLDDFCHHKLDMILLEDDEVIFDRAVEATKMIAAYEVSHNKKITFCVHSSLLEEDLRKVATNMKLIHEKQKENQEIRLIQPDEWTDSYTEKGYSEDEMMVYLVPDFQLEIFR